MKDDEMRRVCSIYGETKKCIQNFGWKTQRQQLELKLKWILRKYGGRVWTGFIWLRIGTGGRFL
jgi:hypothetical protein